MNQQTTEHDRPTQSLIDFPAEFPIKVMGKNQPDFRALVLDTCHELISPEHLIRLEEQLSRSENYLSYTIVGLFNNQSEIDFIYQRFSNSPLVSMAL